MTPHVVALISKKGGVGKTTSAVNLSAAVAESGRRVLLLDLDPQANASLSLGVRRGELAPSMADVLTRNLPLREAVRRTSTDGLDLVTASVDLESLERGDGYIRQSESALRDRLGRVEDYDLVVIDCPGSFTLLTRIAVNACDGYIVPAMPHFLAVEGIRALVDSVERLRRRSSVGARLLGILPTMVDYRTKLTREVLDEVREEFGRNVFAIEIRTNVRLAEAPGTGASIFVHDPEATGAKAYRLAAEELLLRLDELPEDARPRPVALPLSSSEGGGRLPVAPAPRSESEESGAPAGAQRGPVPVLVRS